MTSWEETGQRGGECTKKSQTPAPWILLRLTYLDAEQKSTSILVSQPVPTLENFRTVPDCQTDYGRLAVTNNPSFESRLGVDEEMVDKVGGR